MDTLNKLIYESPNVEVIEIQVEKGFASSSDGDPEGINNGGTI